MSNTDDKLLKSISTQLKHAKFDDATLKNVFETAKLIQSRVPVTRVFPEGIVAPDGVSLEAEFDAGQMALLAELLKAQRDIRDLKVFPIGIVAPDKFRVVVNLR